MTDEPMCPLADDMVLIVVGSSLRAEEADRPLAYHLWRRLEELTGRPAMVISDYRYLYEDKCWRNPTICIGGPGVNALTHKWLDQLPFALVAEDEFFVQLSEPGQCPACASIWGVDHETTKTALATFVDRFIPQFLGVNVQQPA